MKKFLFFLFAAVSIFALSSCRSFGVEFIDNGYYDGYNYNPYGTVYYYGAPVVTYYTRPVPPPPRPHRHHHR